MAWHLASACKSLFTHCMWLCCLGCSAFEGFPLFWHGLLWSSPSLLCGLLARLSVQLYSSLSLGSFVALGFQRVYGMALFGLGLRPGNTIGFNEGLFLSCVFASCSSCSLALVVMAAAGWGKKRGGSSDPAANSATECQLSRQGDTYLLEVWPWAQRNEATRRRVHTTFAARLRPLSSSIVTTCGGTPLECTVHSARGASSGCAYDQNGDTAPRFELRTLRYRAVPSLGVNFVDQTAHNRLKGRLGLNATGLGSTQRAKAALLQSSALFSSLSLGQRATA